MAVVMKLTFQELHCINFLSMNFSVIQNIADSRPKVRYLIAKDDANNTLEEVVKVCDFFFRGHFVKLQNKGHICFDKS